MSTSTPVPLAAKVNRWVDHPRRWIVEWLGCLSHKRKVQGLSKSTCRHYLRKMHNHSLLLNVKNVEFSVLLWMKRINYYSVAGIVIVTYSTKIRTVGRTTMRGSALTVARCPADGSCLSLPGNIWGSMPKLPSPLLETCWTDPPNLVLGPDYKSYHCSVLVLNLIPVWIDWHQ